MLMLAVQYLHLVAFFVLIDRSVVVEPCSDLQIERSCRSYNFVCFLRK
jgi:hypothetical protein